MLRKQGQAGGLTGFHMSPRDIFGFKQELIDGEQKLTQLRLMEKILVPDGDYGEKEVEQVRVLTPGAFEIHQKDQKGDFRVIDEGTTSLEEIPFSVAYSNRVNVMESRPPMADIAELNLKAYQVQSDLDNQLHLSAVPLLGLLWIPAILRRGKRRAWGSNCISSRGPR